MRKNIKYEAPKMEISYLELSDVITASLVGGDEGDNDVTIDAGDFEW